jgi:predicted XRE-type DNA-binding protein
MAKHEKVEITKGSFNVFEDLGFEDAPELLAKAQLTYQIHTLIKKRRLTHRQAAAILKLARPDVTALMNGRFTPFSIERLMRLLMRLNHDVEILVKPLPRNRRQGRLSVKAA